MSSRRFVDFVANWRHVIFVILAVPLLYLIRDVSIWATMLFFALCGLSIVVSYAENQVTKQANENTAKLFDALDRRQKIDPALQFILGHRDRRRQLVDFLSDDDNFPEGPPW